MRAHVQIIGTGEDATVSLDGVPVPAGTINRIDLRATPGSLPRLELRFVITRKAVLEVDADVVVDDTTATVLQQLGWTPPAPAAAADQAPAG
ncbi:hypothetical protein ACIBSW_06800 [Actinoplanes sp. NPDC049668]|uniref:hypothetical protein n=1 Tax=unclassified Actinoplanes TaxID=2626549 RepID=UPI0033A2E1B4